MSTNDATLRAALLPRSNALTDTALVVGGAAFIAVCAQVAIPLWFTPVPLTLQTFAVLGVGAALGAWRGGAATLLYLLAGAVGLPVYAEGAAGTARLLGATGGYLVGMVLAAVLVGWLAQRRAADRRLATSVLAMVAGDVVVLGVGTVWLAVVLGVPMGRAVALGVTPFLAVEVLKVAAAAGALPAAWRGVRRADRRR